MGLILALVVFCTASKNQCSPPTLAAVTAEHGEGCQGSAIHSVKCAPGLSCLAYNTPAVNSGYGGAFCELPCNSWADCPEGYQCSYVADGPWQVCTRSTTADVSLCADAIHLDSSLPGVTQDPSTGMTVVYDDTTAYSSTSEPYQCVFEGNYGAPEAIYQFEAPATGMYRFWLDPEVTHFDAILYLSTACPVSPDNCTGYDDDAFPVLGNDQVNMLLHKGEEILVFVDGKDDSFESDLLLSGYPNGGPFKLVISLD